MAIFHHFWKFWYPNCALEKKWALEIYFIFFEKYTISAFKRTSIRVFWTSKKKSILLGTSVILPNFELFLGYFYAILCDFRTLGPNFIKTALEKNFIFLFLKSTRSQLSNALRFKSFGLLEQNEHYFLPCYTWS